MNEQELRDFLQHRQKSPHAARREITGLACFGCAHSSAIAPPPGMPSGERPCMSCVRNPDRERDARDHEVLEPKITVGDDGHARIFDPFAGSMYNGAPRLYFPMDNYVTLDHADQDEWMAKHPEYAKPVRFQRDGTLHVTDLHVTE